jgi:hypothetical protein
LGGALALARFGHIEVGEPAVAEPVA